MNSTPPSSSSYSKWDHYQEEEDDDHDYHESSQHQQYQSRQQLIHIRDLKAKADDLFARAEDFLPTSSPKSSVLLVSSPTSAYKHYEESIHCYDRVLTLIDTTEELLQSSRFSFNLQQQKVACYLNIACCYLRIKRNFQAIEACDHALLALQSSSSVDGLVVLRAKYFKAFALLERTDVTWIDVQEAQVEVQDMKAILKEIDIEVNHLHDYRDLFKLLKEKEKLFKDVDMSELEVRGGNKKVIPFPDLDNNASEDSNNTSTVTSPSTQSVSTEATTSPVRGDTSKSLIASPQSGVFQSQTASPPHLLLPSSSTGKVKPKNIATLSIDTNATLEETIRQYLRILERMNKMTDWEEMLEILSEIRVLANEDQNAFLIAKTYFHRADLFLRHHQYSQAYDEYMIAIEQYRQIIQLQEIQVEEINGEITGDVVLLSAAEISLATTLRDFSQCVVAMNTSHTNHDINFRHQVYLEAMEYVFESIELLEHHLCYVFESFHDLTLDEQVETIRIPLHQNIRQSMTLLPPTFSEILLLLGTSYELAMELCNEVKAHDKRRHLLVRSIQCYFVMFQVLLNDPFQQAYDQLQFKETEHYLNILTIMIRKKCAISIMKLATDLQAYITSTAVMGRDDDFLTPFPMLSYVELPDELQLCLQFPTDAKEKRASVAAGFEMACRELMDVTEYLLAFQCGKQCGEILLDSFHIKAFHSAIISGGKGSTEAILDVEQAEYCHDIWRLTSSLALKLTAERSLLQKQLQRHYHYSENELNANALLVKYKFEALLASYHAGLCAACGHQYTLAQRSFESAQSIQSDLQGLLIASFSETEKDVNKRKLASDVRLACGDVAFHVGHVYFKQGKYNASIEEGQQALQLYSQCDEDEDVSSRLRHSFVLLALAYSTMGNMEEAEEAIKCIEQQIIGPIDGKRLVHV